MKNCGITLIRWKNETSGRHNTFFNIALFENFTVSKFFHRLQKTFFHFFAEEIEFNKQEIAIASEQEF